MGGQHERLVDNHRGVEQFEAPHPRTSPRCRRGRTGPDRRSPVRRSWRWPDPTGPSPARSPAARAPAGARPARPGTSWPPRSWPDPTHPTSPAIDENITNADRSRSRVNSCRFHAASTLARNTASTRSGRQRRHHRIVERPGGVNHRRQRMLHRDIGDHLGQRLPIRRVTGHHLHLRARRGQLGDQLRRPRRIRATPTHQHQVAHPVTGHHMTGQRRTGHPGAAGDQHRAGRPSIRHRHHDLADMARLAQIPQRRGRPPHVKRRDRQRPQHVLAEQRGQLGRASAGCGPVPLRRGRRRGSAHPGVVRRPTPGSRMSVLPISRNTPPGATSRSEASTKSPASESSTTSTPRPPVTARNFSSNSRLRESEMWSSSKPMARNVSHLPRLAVANTSSPKCRASCTAAIPTPPAAACTSTRCPGCTPGQVHQRVVGGGEDHRGGGGGGVRPSRRHLDQQSLVGGRDRAGAFREQAHDPVADRETACAGAGFDDRRRTPRRP